MSDLNASSPDEDPRQPAGHYVLAVGVYNDPQEAVTDLRDLTNPGPVAEVVAGAAILTRSLTRAQMQQGGGGSTAYGIGTGAAVGVAAGAVIALPLVGAAAGAVIGGLVGHHLKRRETEHLIAILNVDLPPNGTALVAVVPEGALTEVREAMTRATRTTGRLLEDEESRRMARGLVRGDPVATEALGGHS